MKCIAINLDTEYNQVYTIKVIKIWRNFDVRRNIKGRRLKCEY